MDTKPTQSTIKHSQINQDTSRAHSAAGECNVVSQTERSSEMHTATKEEGDKKCSSQNPAASVQHMAVPLPERHGLSEKPDDVIIEHKHVPETNRHSEIHTATKEEVDKKCTSQNPAVSVRVAIPQRQVVSENLDDEPVEHKHVPETNRQAEGTKEEEESRKCTSSQSPVRDEEEVIPGRRGLSENSEDAEKVPDTNKQTLDTLPPQGKMTKNQLKKIRKRQEWQVMKEKRILQRRVKRQERRHKKQAEKQETEERSEVIPPRKRRRKMADPDASDVRVVIDCGFDDLMGKLDVTKLSKQIQRSYASNRTSDNPFQFYICNFGGQTQTRFEDSLAEYKNWDVNFRKEGLNEVFDKDCIVYLSAESPNVLTTLDPEKVYVIGGLVDHNHHKGICHERAVATGWGHAQLPIKEFMHFNARKVLTVNHVFEILVAYTETNDWGMAFDRVIPQRKFQTMSKKQRRKKFYQEKSSAGGEDAHQNLDDDDELSGQEETAQDEDDERMLQEADKINEVVEVQGVPQ